MFVTVTKAQIVDCKKTKNMLVPSVVRAECSLKIHVTTHPMASEGECKLSCGTHQLASTRHPCVFLSR